jgi:Flp pilus assembly protein TadG
MRFMTRKPRNSRSNRRLLTRLRTLPGATSGVAAVEFAMVLPIMLLMYLGMTEVTVAVNMDRKLTILSRTLADLTGRMPSVSNTEMTTIFGAALSVMAPYESSDVGMRVSSVVITSNNGSPRASVCWSDGRNLAARPVGETVPVPEGFDVPGTSFILAEVQKLYVPMLGHAITGNINLNESTPWPVRNVTEVVRAGTRCL